MAMNPSQARVVNPILTDVARGYANQKFVGSELFPIIPVAQRGGKIISFGKEKLSLQDTERAPRANIARSDSGYGSDDYALQQHAIEEQVGVEEMEEAGAVPGIDLGSGAVNTGMEKILLRLEYSQATLARNASNYAVDNTATLSGTSQWSHADAKPASAIRNASSVIRSKMGVLPNVLLLSHSVFAAAQENPSIIERIKYTGRDSVTPEIMAGLFGVERVVVGAAIYFDRETGSPLDIWGNDAVLAYVSPATLAQRGNQSYGYTYRLRNYPIAEEPYYERNSRSWIYPIVDEHNPVIAGPDAGFLFKNAVS